MLSLFSYYSRNTDEDKDKDEENNDLSESDSDYEEDIDDVLGEIMYEKIILDNIPYKLIKTTARDLIPKVEVFCFNRKLNEEHINNIYNDLKTEKNPFLMNTFKIVSDTNNKRRILDGNHRLCAIYKILEEDHKMEWNLDIFVELFVVKDLEEQIVLDLYKIANKTLNVSVEDEPVIFFTELIKKICKEPILKNGIIDRTTTKKVNKPRIAKRELYELFKDNYILKNNKKSIPQIIDRIKELNHKLSLMSNEEIFGKKISKTHLSQREKANKYKFYLNMSGSKYTPEYWIRYILKN